MKSAWVAAGAAAVAALMVLGACTDSVASKIAAPSNLEPRQFDVLPIGALHSEIWVCLDPNSSPGTYHFVISQDAFPTPEATDVVTTSLDLVPGFAGGPCVLVLKRSTTTGDNYVIDTNNGNILANFDHDNPPAGTAAYNPPANVHITGTGPAGYTVAVSCTGDEPILVVSCAANPIIIGANVFHGSSVTYKFTAPVGSGQIAPTLTTCEDYANGTSSTLSTLLVGFKGSKINNASPGVFFYYANVTLGASATVGFTQTVTPNPGVLPKYVVQQTQAYLYTFTNGSCTRVATLGLTDGGTTASGGPFAAGIYILGVKFSTEAAKGTNVANASLLTSGSLLATHNYQATVGGVADGSTSASVNTNTK